jgi:beta-glucanase (GH16 family)
VNRLRVFLVALVLITPVFADPPSGGNWVAIPEFTDEFDGTLLDEKKWQKGNPTWLGRQPGLFVDHNIALNGGTLKLSMRAENLPKMPEGYKDYTCASVTSRNRVRYGFFEVRAKIMNSKGASAFWFYHNTPEQWTEIDVFEMCAGGSKEEKKLHTNVHVMHAPGVTKEIAYPEFTPLDFDPAKEFHTYAVEWDVEFIRWYVDGRIPTGNKRSTCSSILKRWEIGLACPIQSRSPAFMKSTMCVLGRSVSGERLS